MDYKQTIKDRLSESLDPEMQARYKKRRSDAIAQQDANYQGPEAVEALADGQRTRALMSGLARAANKFGSVGGDGGQETSVPESMKGFDTAASTAFAGKQDLYDRGVKAEDSAMGALDGAADRSTRLAGTLDEAERTGTMRERQDADYTRTQGMQADEDDANSAVSKSYQELAKRYAPGMDFSGASASQLKEKIKPLGEMFRIKEQSDAKREAARQFGQSQEANRLDREAARAAASSERKATKDDEYARRREDKLMDEKRAADNKPPTEGQTNAALYGKRMESAEAQFEALEREGFDRTGMGPAFQDAVVPEFAMGERSKMQTQAERNFLTAVLRRESGASISPGEFDTGSKIYFPRLGDSEAVIKQKKQSRTDAINGIKSAAGENAVVNVQKAEAGNQGGAPKVYSAGEIPEAD